MIYSLSGLKQEERVEGADLFHCREVAERLCTLVYEIYYGDLPISDDFIEVFINKAKYQGRIHQRIHQGVVIAKGLVEAQSPYLGKKVPAVSGIETHNLFSFSAASYHDVAWADERRCIEHSVTLSMEGDLDLLDLWSQDVWAMMRPPGQRFPRDAMVEPMLGISTWEGFDVNDAVFEDCLTAALDLCVKDWRVETISGRRRFLFEDHSDAVMVKMKAI